jgi:NADH-quinone oxidoreductase subunit G
LKACNPPGEAKEDWKIIVALAKKFNKKFNYFNIDDVRNRLRKVNSRVFSSLNKDIRNNFMKFGKKGKISDIPFDLSVSNFYSNDVISKSSKIMQQCSNQICNKNL